MAKLTKEERRQKELQALFNSAWSRVTLHGYNLGQVLKFLGLPQNGYTPEQQAERPTYELFSQIKQRALSTEVSAAVTKIEEPKNVIFDRVVPYYNDEDTLIESTEYQGHKIPKKSRREQIHEAVIDILPPHNPKQQCTLYYFQQEEAELSWLKVFKQGHRGRLIRANTGDGKTYWMGQMLRWLLDYDYATRCGCCAPYPYVVVTKASIVEQTSDDFRKEFGIKVPQEVLVINYDSLRATFGKFFIDERIIVDHGEEHTVWKWRSLVHPVVLFLDEYQAVKNTNSKQSTIVSAFMEIDKGPTANKTLVFSLSATPFAKVESAKVFCLSTRKPINYGFGMGPITSEHWPREANRMASPGKPQEYSKAAIKRVVEEYDEYIGGFRNVRRKHNAINEELIIQFRTSEAAERYAKALEEYEKELKTIEERGGGRKEIFKLVALLKFRMAAELERAPDFAERMYNDVKAGYAACCACNFKPSIAKTLYLLHTEYGVSRDNISLIWGGDSAFGTEQENKYSPEEIRSILKSALTEEVPQKVLKEILKQLQYESAGIGNMPQTLRLGIQSREERWREIQKFQNGQSLYCFFTFGAGGAGLSLHHKYEHTRPRRMYCAPTYNEMEMNQALGRCPRLTSLSDTEQWVLLYAGTIEIAVLTRVNHKTQCLRTVIEHSEGTNEGDNKLLNQILELSGALVDEDDEDSDLGHEVFEEHEREKEQQDEDTGINPE